MSFARSGKRICFIDINLRYVEETFAFIGKAFSIAIVTPRFIDEANGLVGTDIWFIDIHLMIVGEAFEVIDIAFDFVGLRFRFIDKMVEFIGKGISPVDIPIGLMFKKHNTKKNGSIH